MRDFWQMELRRCERGAVGMIAAFSTLFLLAVGALAVDFGRMVVLKSQLQNYADAAAAAGAAYLDGSDEAITKARQVASSTIRNVSHMVQHAPQLHSVTFYSAVSPTKVVTTNASMAQYIEVRVEDERLNFLIAPLMRSFASAGSQENFTHRYLGASTIATGRVSACGVPPLMMCDLSETMGSDYDVLSSLNAGRQVKLMKGSQGLAPGNFGALDTPSGSQASQDISAQMAAVNPPGCYEPEIGTTPVVDTAPGNRAGPIADGINARFDLPSPPQNFADPAPNVINYPKDSNVESSRLGNGNWDFEGYWNAKHAGAPLPAQLGSSPTRYQVYLYELGESFAMNGRNTLYPAPSPAPAGYHIVTSADSPGIPQASSNGDRDDPNFDGVPEENPAVDDPRRRVMQVAILQCQSDNVQGNGGPYPTYGRYVELFVTESVEDDHTIYGEILRKITPSNSDHLRMGLKYAE